MLKYVKELNKRYVKESNKRYVKYSNKRYAKNRIKYNVFCKKQYNQSVYL